MIDYSDPCSFAPCAVACRDQDLDEAVSVFGVKKNAGGGNGNQFPSNPMTPRGLLMSRISEFQVKGWLSQQEHRKYAELLTGSPKAGNNNGNPENDQPNENVNPNENEKPKVSIKTLQDLEKELDKMEEKFGGGSGIFHKTKRIANILSESNCASYMPPGQPVHTSHAERPHGMSVFPGPKSSKDDGGINKNKRNVRLDASPSIVEPKDLSKICDLTHPELQELFVEMCFFARLGFVQPPCCLQCTYRESMKEAVPNTQCPKWVVWRKSATELLHPKNMEGNAMVVQCHAARKLLSGESVDGFRWDKKKKVLSHESE